MGERMELSYALSNGTPLLNSREKLCKSVKWLVAASTRESCDADGDTGWS